MSNIAIFNPGAVVANQVVEYKISVNTPDYENDPLVVINPDLSLLESVPMKYWVVNDGVVVEMTPEQKTAVDSFNLPDVKNNKKRYLQNRSNALLNSQGYTYDVRSNLLSMYSDGIRMRPNGQQYIQPWVNWLRTVDENIKQKNDAVDAATTESEVQSIELDESSLIAGDPQITTMGSVAIVDSSSLSNFLDGNAEVTDSTTGIKGPFYLMQELFHRKDLYNDSENPLYDASHTPILGTGGILNSQVTRISSIETIHQKLGWHEQEVTKANYSHPKDLLIYYGWLNSFNSATNGWNNEKVAQDMAKYYLFSFGDGLQNPSHGDFSNTQTIIPRLKNLNSEALIFGYVAVAQDMSAFQTKVDQWDTLQVHGIFLDEAGYDFGTDRSGFNARVDYVHGKTYSNLAFANAWNIDHVLGTNNDVSYPNTTYNPNLLPSTLTSNDWILLESYPINTSSYTSTGGYESEADWALRGVKMESLRATYGVNFAAGGVIDNTSANGNDLYKFGATSALMWSLEGFGTSDNNYGASSAAVKFWNRPDWAGLGKTWNLNPSIQIGLDNTNIVHRFAGDAHFTLNFTDGSHSSMVDMIGYTGAQGGSTGIQGVTGIQGLGITGIQGTTGIQEAVPNSSYRILAQANASHIAGKVAGTYMLGNGDPAAVSGTGVLYPIVLIPIYTADIPTVNATTKLRIRAVVSVNNIAPTGNFTVGLYPVSSGAGGTGVKVYTTGTLVSGSAATTVTTPGGSSMTSVAGSDFAIPADGIYCLAVVTTATVANNSLVHINAILQMRNA